MLVFIIGATIFNVLLGWLTVKEYKGTPPSGWKAWVEFGAVVSAQICVWAVIVKAAVS